MSLDTNLDIGSYSVYRFDKGKVTRLELFLNRDNALEAAGLTAKANIEENK